MHRTRGQSTLDYVAVLAIVGALTGVGAAIAQASDVGRRVTRAMARAICLVRNGDCWRDKAPCVLGSSSTATDGHVTIVIVRVGGGYEALVERRSDGRFAITRVLSGEGGLDFGSSLKGSISLKGSAIALGGEARAAVLGHLSSGRTWVVDSEAEADELLKDLPFTDRRPDERYGEKGWSVTLGASGSLGVSGGGLEIGAKDIYGTRRIAENGHDVVYVKESQHFTAAVQAGTLSLGAGKGRRKGDAGGADGAEDGRGSATAAGAEAGAGVDVDVLKAGAEYDRHEDAIYGIERDRDGRPISLSVTTVGEYAASVDLPDRLQPIAGLLASHSVGRRAYQLEQRLDLTDPANLAVATAAMQQITSPRPNLNTAVSVSRALQRRLDVAGTAEARTYAVDESSTGVQGAARYNGIGLVAGVSVTNRSTRLLTATSRGLDGQWIRREDCVTA